MAISYVGKTDASDTGTSIDITHTASSIGNILIACITAVDAGGGLPEISFESGWTELQEVAETLGDRTTIALAYKLAVWRKVLLRD